MKSDATALIVPIPAAEAMVAPWRGAHDPAAGQGVPAHITLLYPFLPPEQVTGEVLARLGQLFAGFEAFSLMLHGPESFPGLLHLRPEPAEPFVEMREALRALWPEIVPYGGKYGDQPPPHLTVAWSSDRVETGAPDFERIAAALRPSLPIAARATEAWLEQRRDEHWSQVANFPLGRP